MFMIIIEMDRELEDNKISILKIIGNIQHLRGYIMSIDDCVELNSKRLHVIEDQNKLLMDSFDDLKNNIMSNIDKVMNHTQFITKNADLISKNAKNIKRNSKRFTVAIVKNNDKIDDLINRITVLEDKLNKTSSISENVLNNFNNKIIPKPPNKELKPKSKMYNSITLIGHRKLKKSKNFCSK